MTRTCPNCGSRAIDEQSQFCNKCGTPFPAEDKLKKVVVRTTPRLTDSPPPPAPVQQHYPETPPVPEYYPPAASSVPARPAAVPRKTRAPPAPARKPAMIKSGKGGFFRFERLITTQKFVRFLYLAGVIAIILLSLLVISSGFLKSTTDSAEGEADSDKASSARDATGTILTGVILLVFGNLFWRIFCEVLAMIITIKDSLTAGTPPGTPGPLADDDTTTYGEGGSGEMVACPVCGKIVPADDLEFCDHCGVQGCSSCVRKMGLIKKTFTCRDCFEKK